MTTQILRLPQVKEITGLSRSSIYQMIADGAFPQPIKLTGPNGRAVGWVLEELHDFLAQKAQARVTVGK